MHQGTPGPACIRLPASNSIESKSVPEASVKMDGHENYESTEEQTDQIMEEDDESATEGYFSEYEGCEGPTLLLPTTLSLYAKQQLKEKAERKKKWSVPSEDIMDKDSNSSGDSEPDPNIPSRRHIPDPKSGGSMGQKKFSFITMPSLSRALASVKTKINEEPVPGFSGNLIGERAAATRGLISSFDLKLPTQEIQPDSVSAFDFDLELGLAYVSPEIEPDEIDANVAERTEISIISESDSEYEADFQPTSIVGLEQGASRSSFSTRKSKRAQSYTPKASSLQSTKVVELNGIPEELELVDDDDKNLSSKSNDSSRSSKSTRKSKKAPSSTSKSSSLQSTQVVEHNGIPEEFESVAHDDINLSSKSNNSSRSSFSTRKSKQAPSSTSKASSMQLTQVLELNGISDAHDDKNLSSKSNDSSKSSFSTRKSKRAPSSTSIASGLSPNKKICMNNLGIASESDVIIVENKSSSKSSEVSGTGIGVRKLKRTPPSKSAESSSKSLSKRSRLERIVNGASKESEIGNEEDLSTESRGTSGSKHFGIKPRTSVNSNVSISSLKSSGSESVIILSEDISIPPVNKTGNKSETTKRGFSSSSDESSTLKRLKPRWLVDFRARMSRNTNTTREEADEIWEKLKLEKERKRKMAEENASTPPITFGYTGPSVPAGPSGPKIFGDRSWEKPVLYANNGPRGIFPIYDPWEAMMDRVGDIVEMTRCPWLIDSATGKRFDPNNC